MSNNIGNDSAFPFVVSEASSEAHTGLTKREWLAGVIMQGMAASSFWGENFQAATPFELSGAAHTAVASADALIAELSKPHASLDH